MDPHCWPLLFFSPFSCASGGLVLVSAPPFLCCLGPLCASPPPQCCRLPLPLAAAKGTEGGHLRVVSGGLTIWNEQSKRSVPIHWGCRYCLLATCFNPPLAHCDRMLCSRSTFGTLFRGIGRLLRWRYNAFSACKCCTNALQLHACLGVFSTSPFT